MIQYNDCRDEKILAEMRPVLFLEEVEQDIENFQNQTLRPILKMQHDLLMDVLISQPNVDAVMKYKEKRSVFSERLRIFIQQPILKGVFLGCIVGCLTREEFSLYQQNKKEYNKRIGNMLLQRFVDSF